MLTARLTITMTHLIGRSSQAMRWLGSHCKRPGTPNSPIWRLRCCSAISARARSGARATPMADHTSRYALVGEPPFTADDLRLSHSTLVAILNEAEENIAALKTENAALKAELATLKEEGNANG